LARDIYMRFYKNTRVLLNDNRMTTDIYIMLQKTKRKNSSFWASQTPEVLNSVSKNWMAGIFPRVALSIRRRRWLLLPWRNTTTTKKRARKKREETRPRESKLPRTRTPFVRSFPPASFHSSAIFTFPRYKKKRLICASPREKANDEEKSSHPSTLYHR